MADTGETDEAEGEEDGGGPVKRSFWQRWNSWTGLLIRVAIYAAILIVFLSWPTPKQPEPRIEEDPAPLEPGEVYYDLRSFAPLADFVAWSRAALPDGRQEIQVLVRFLSNTQIIDWSDAKLRGPAGAGGDDLASAEAPPQTPRPVPGPAKLVFQLPTKQPEFVRGRVFCCNKDLCELNADGRVTPEELESRWKQELEKPPEKLAPPPPASGPVTPEKR
jgi:hypothetical protein